MSYCDVSDVQSEVQIITFAVSSKPTIAEVTSWCAEISTIMDSRFNAIGVTTPVVDANKLVVVGDIAKNGVLAKIWRSINTDSQAARDRQKLFDDAMKQIETRPAILQTAESSSSPAASFSNNEEAADDDYNDHRSFRRGRHDW